MVPASGLMKPSHISTVVVLPAPLGPSSASTSAALHLEVESVDGASSTRTAW